jgi:5-methylcytosine-specific restriction protein B
MPQNYDFFKMFRFANHFPIEIFCIFEARFFTSEKMNETRKRLIIDLLERYKEKFLETPLSKDGVDELYKWELITKCHEKTEVEIIRNFKPKNIVHVQTVYPVLTELLKNNQQQLVDCFNGLKDENRSLSERLSVFKKEMGNLCGDKFKSRANDERTAAAFLTCWNPDKYTFFIDKQVYKPYCNFICEQLYETGEKYPHYLQLLPELIEIIKQDAELMNKFQNETNGLIQSDLLIAQNILWQMRKDMMTGKRSFFEDFYNTVKSKLDKDGYSLQDFPKEGGHIWIDSVNFKATSEHHYEFNCENSKKAGHNGNNIYVEIHFEGDNYSIYEKVLKNIGTILSFPWNSGRQGFRMNNEGYAMIGDVDDVAEKAINELYELDRLIGKTIKQTINNMKTYTEIEKLTQLLNLKRNIILQGAPGTGKTYNTAALALSICGEAIPETHDDVMKRYVELRKEGRIGFCTFHQSMDYEDFVEGIKPKTENGAISYDVEDGIFKALSDKARENYEDSQKTIEVLQKQKSIQDKMYDFLQDALENRTEFLTRLGYKFIITEITDKNIIVSIITENNIATGEPIKNSTLTIRLSELTELLEKEVVLNEIGDIPAYFNRKTKLSRDYYTFYIANEINKIKTKNVNVQKTELQNYVLIIDEINRGNVSKIFGELITLLEADKRIGGEHPIKLTLPYSKESFGVPSNLYIIGTMNTTDRSVGNIDYAVRRRFAFVTLESKEEVIEQHYKNDETLKNKTLELFNSVKAFLIKHKFDMDIADLMVGHSYFLAKDEEELGLKWKYEIVPLLHEYYKDGITKQDVKADTSIDDFCNSK